MDDSALDKTFRPIDCANIELVISKLNKGIVSSDNSLQDLKDKF